MTPLPGWLVGLPVSEVPTPALVLDLDGFDANARTIARRLHDQGVQWRPHAKAHGSPVLARRQVDLGAIGSTCATIAEAATLVEGGIHSVLIANQLASPRAAVWLATLQGSAQVIGSIDSVEGGRVVSDAAVAAGTIVPILIEVDIGMERAGVVPGPGLLRLADRLAEAPGLRLLGVMGYEGHTLDVTPITAKEAAVARAIARLLTARDLLASNGLPVGIVSCGGTGSFELTASIAGVTEIQAGGGCLYDCWYAEACGVKGLVHALTVHATVTSRPQPARAIIDAGMKALSTSDGPPRPLIEGAAVTSLYAEHGVLSLEGAARDLAVGDRIVLIPGYSDSTTVLHGGFIGVRAGVVESIIPRPVRWPA